MRDLQLTEGFDVGLEMSGARAPFATWLEQHESRLPGRAVGLFSLKHDHLDWNHGHLQRAAY